MYRTFKMTDYKSKNQSDQPQESSNTTNTTTPNKQEEIHKIGTSKSTTPIRLQSSVLHKNINNQVINSYEKKEAEVREPIQIIENKEKTEVSESRVIYKAEEGIQEEKEMSRLKRMDSIHSSEENANIFSEFKLKYDELKSNYDKLRIDHDEITREYKKMEIKLFNANPEYYEKEIKRLRTEVEKYQEENEDNKHKYLLAENGKKENEASLKVKNEELNKTLKQLEKEKIQNVELKHQNEEKERVFGRIRVEFEKSSETISKNYDDAVTKINKLDGGLKAKTAELDEINKNYQRLDRRYTELKEEYKKYKEVNEEKQKSLTKTFELNTTESFKTKSELTEKITYLSQQIEKYEHERTSIELIKERKSEEIGIIKENRQLELDVVRLEDKIRDLEFMLIKKDEILINVQKSVEKVKIDNELKELRDENIKLIEEKDKLSIEFEKVKAEYQKEIDKLKIEKFSHSPEKSTNSTNNFQEILKTQLDENSKLKTELAFKIDEIYNLKSDIDEVKVEKQNLEREMDIMKKIKKTEEKNAKLDSEIANQYMKSDLDSFKRKIDVLENKLNSKIKEVKEKDNFIMNSVLGRSKPEDAPLILTDFQRVFEANYVEKLAEANSRISDLMAGQK